MTPLLKITAERAHTHPEALISALNTYVRQLDNWDWTTREKHWCHVVGLAQRLLPPPVAQQICEEVELNQNKNFHASLRRSFQFYNFVPPEGYQVWFPLNRLGVDFGILNYALAGHGVLGWRRPTGVARGNSAALTALCETRTNDVKMLGEQLSAAVKQLAGLAQGSMPSTPV